jgi:hypothetical protein
MQLDVQINEDETQVAIHLADDPPGYTLVLDAEGLEEFIGILLDVRQRMQPPHFLPGEEPLDDDED